MHVRSLALVACAALLLGACGSRVPPQVFEELVASGAGAEGGAAGVATTSGGILPGEPGSLELGGAAGEPTSSDGGISAAGAATTGDGTSGGATGGSTGTTSGGTTGGGAATTGGGGTSGGGTSGGTRNHASDVGVTADRILVGNITTEGGPMGAAMFTPMVQGARAYFAWRNSQGGINGRLVEMAYCDDKGDPDRNRQCARQLVEQQKVFAFVANSVLNYAGAEFVSAQGVPDVGGQPVGTEYFTYPTLFAVRGGEYPRDGEVGYEGKLYNGTAIFHFLKEQLGVSRAAVFYYNIPVSKAYGTFQVEALKAEGYELVQAYEVNPALPSYDSHVADMEAKGVQVIFDAMDLTGNQNLCQSMQRNDFAVQAKVSIVSSWSRRVEQQFPEICKRSMFVWGESIPYSLDTEELRRLRRTIHDVYGGQLDDSLHQWHVEGWLAAKMFAEGVERMGADVTRAGLIEWLDSFTPQSGYGGGGLIVPQSWQPLPYEQVDRVRECIAIGKWDLRAKDFLSVGSYPFCYDRSQLIAWEPAA